MRKLYYECFCGISGDMNLGAMIDLGVDPAWLEAELKKLPIADEFELKIHRAKKHGIEGTKVDVILKGAPTHHHDHGHKHDHDHHHHDHGHKHDHDHHHHDHDHKHDHDHHHHDHDHKHEHDHHHEHGHHHSHDRNMQSIAGMIDASELPQEVKALSLKIFEEIAVAEAKVHGTTVDKIHFHEVGAVDAIVDIVGAALCFHALQIDEVISSPIQVGGGFVKCDHGLMPVPAPATAEILRGVPIKTGLVQTELATPTGAAILKSIVNRYETSFDLIPGKVGYGLGTKNFEYPNLVRVILTDSEEATLEKKNKSL